MSDNIQHFITYDSEDYTDNTLEELERRVDQASSDSKLDEEIQALVKRIE